MAQPELFADTPSDLMTAASIVAASKLVGMMATVQAIDEALAAGDVEVARRRCHAVLVESPDVNEEYVLAQILQLIGDLRSHARESTDIAALNMLDRLAKLTCRLT